MFFHSRAHCLEKDTKLTDPDLCLDLSLMKKAYAVTLPLGKPSAFLDFGIVNIVLSK